MTQSVMIGELAWPEYDRLVKDGETMVLLPIEGPARGGQT